MDYPPQEPYNEVAEQVGLHAQSQQGAMIANQNNQLQYQMEEVEKNLAESQLDVNETLEDIRHQLRQDTFTIENGQAEWKPIKDEKRRILTDEGVDKIMQIMKSYINKETLLSNFDEKTIARRMLEFSLAFSGLIFLKYEVFFRSPSIEECKDILKNRIEDKINKRRMSAEVFEKDFDEAKVKAEILAELEPRMDYELDKIKSEKTKLNLREFEMMFTQLRALVESIHNRAWKGEERGSLRRHFNISEVIGGSPNRMPEKKGGIFSRWGRN